MSNVFAAILVFAILASSSLGCANVAQDAAKAGAEQATSTAGRKPENQEIILATTTSTRDSGLLDILIPMFQERTGYHVKPIAVGSGQAMVMGERAEADVLLVHAPDSEREFMARGHGGERKLVMHNDFVVVGPEADPAGIKGVGTAREALARIAAATAFFFSRGDGSGTHQIEAKLWREANIDPKGREWYKETGQGMGATLNIASEKNGYTVSDRATYLATRGNLALQILVEGDKSLLNVYHVITVNPQKSPKINIAGAKAFAEFIVASDAQATIGRFGVDKFGQPLFFPDAGKKDQDVGG